MFESAKICLNAQNAEDSSYGAIEGHFSASHTQQCSGAHDCGLRVGKFHPWLFSNFRFIFSRYTRCIRCATEHVHRGSKRDRIDSNV